jgi:hypothetical protein
MLSWQLAYGTFRAKATRRARHLNGLFAVHKVDPPLKTDLEMSERLDFINKNKNEVRILVRYMREQFIRQYASDEAQDA